MARALRYDGLLPNVMEANGHVRMGPPTPDEVRQMRAYVEAERGAGTPFDIVVEGSTPGDDKRKAAEIVGAYAEVGTTWWLETMWTEKAAEKVLQRIRQGPPLYINWTRINTEYTDRYI
jgi:hypothetical protein